MSVWNAIRSEYRYNFGALKRLIPIVAIFLIPILYAGTFLWAFWDPYGHLNRMPVAVVNEDTGSTYHGQTVQAGTQLVDQLKQDDSFAWKFVSSTQASQGMKTNQYFMELEIPANFSKLAANQTSAGAKQPQLIVTTNDKYNYIAAIVGKNAMVQVQEQAAESVAKTYATNLVSGMTQLEQGVSGAAKGASQVAAGAATLSTNADHLNQGAAKVTTAAGTLASKTTDAAHGGARVALGVTQIYRGTSKLNSGLGQLTTAGAKLQSASSATDKGVNQLAAGISQSVEGSAQTALGASQLAAGLQAYAATHPSVAADANFQALLQASQQVAGGTAQVAHAQKQLSAGATQLLHGEGQFSTGMTQFNQQLSKAHQGSQQLVAGMPNLVNGAAQLSTGLNELQSGANQLSQAATTFNGGVDKFSAGVNTLGQGAEQMASKLHQAAAKLPAVNGSQVVKATSDAVGMTHVQSGTIANYGYGFTPYFLSLGLFVGTLLMSIVISFRDPAGNPNSSLAWFLSKFSIVAVVAVIQALITDLVLLAGLGVHVHHPLQFVAFSVVTSVTFVAIVQFFVTSMANPGRFLVVILLILQLTSSSGTYPVILSPRFFQVLHPYLPMTYTVEGFRYLVGGGSVSGLQKDAALLAMYAIGFMVLSLTYFIVRYRRDAHANRQTVWVAE